MSRIGSSLQSVLIREIANNRTEMNDLSRQLSSGRVAESYGGLGSGRTMSLALREEKTQIAGFQNTVTLAKTRVKIMDGAVDHLRNNGSDMRSQLLVAGFEPTDNGQTLAQMQAKTRLSEAVELVNTEVAGRHLFGGAKTDEPPVRPPAELLDGVGSQAGFRQIMDERRQADIGDGKGRLVQFAAGPAETVLSEDIAGSPFGFKIASMRSDLSGVTATGPAGAPAAVNVAFGAPLPADGDQLFITLDLPDGTKTELALTAKSGGDLKAGEFAIGADAATTASNFENALSSLLSAEAKSSLNAASMQVAADDFFVGGTDVAQRVDGPPFDTATGLRDATAEDTVAWYTGDKSTTPARETSFARVTEDTLVAYGARADEAGFSNIMKQFAILSATVIDGSSDNAANDYKAMTDRVSGKLGNSDKSNSLDRIIGELAIAQGSLQEADQRHIAGDNMVTNFLSEIETADINEVATKLLAMQTQLQASYQVTGMLSKLSLANFL